MARSKKSSKKIQSLIFLMLITVILGITATYAWFSTQRDVEISGMRLNVEVAESMQISLDGEKWTQSIQIADMRQFYGTYDVSGDEGFAIFQAKDVDNGGNLNYVPTELVPVSTAGEVSGGKLQFVQGTIGTNADGSQSLTGITACSETDITTSADIEDKEDNNESHPYLVFDMYLRNISAKTSGIDALELNAGSSVFVNAGNVQQEGKGVAGTGLEYSARVGMIVYGNTVSVTAEATADKTVEEQIRGITANNSEVAAIWEPNYKEHTQYVVNNNGRDLTATSQEVTTYGIKTAVAGLTPNSIANVNADTDANSDGIEDTNANLVAVKTFKPAYTTVEGGTDDKEVITNIAGNAIGLAPNQISKVRVYIWLEGQDPDCIDMASTGDKLNVNLKLTKDTNTVNENTYTIKDIPVVGAVETAGTDGDFKYIQLQNGQIQITRYLGSDTNVVIPATYDGYSVYSIGNLDATTSSESRYNIFGVTNSTTNTTITSVTISEGVQKIKTAAFSQCTGLTNLTLPSTLSSIGDSAFRMCSSLTGKLIIPEGVITIGTGGFYKCSSLTGTLTLPNTLTTIGTQAFDRCTALNGDLIIPEGVTTIGAAAFQGCVGLNGTLTLPSTLTSIGENAFYRCSSLSGDLVIPRGVTTIGQSTFNQCIGLDGTLTLPNTLTTIGNAAFNKCSGLTGDLIIPEGVITIDQVAFNECTGLNGTLSLPNTLTTIGYGAFNKCSGLTGDLIIPEGVITIDKAAFQTCTGLNGTLSLPNTLTTIGEYAFNKCLSLTGDLTIKEGVTIIGESAFKACSSLDGTLTLPNTLTRIGDAAFYGCYNLNNTSITIPESVTIIEESAFSNVAAKTLKEYKVDGTNSNFKVIDGVLFDASETRLLLYPPCKVGNTYEIPEEVTIIDMYAFAVAGYSTSGAPETGLKKIILPNSYTLEQNETYGNNLAGAIYAYTGINEIGVKDDNINYKTIDGILYSKDGTTLWYVPSAKNGEVVIEDGVTTIKAGTFMGTAGLIAYTVKIPSSVIEIEETYALQILKDLGSSKVTFDTNCIYEFKADGTIGKK